MSEQHHSPASLSTLMALCERIEAEAPHLIVKGMYEFPRPFVKVKDTLHDIVVGFSSEADYVIYLHLTARKGA